MPHLLLVDDDDLFRESLGLNLIDEGYEVTSFDNGKDALAYLEEAGGADVMLPDVRAGFSAVLAAAVADRPSVLRGIHHIERGYHRPFEQFASLGLTIRRG